MSEQQIQSASWKDELKKLEEELRARGLKDVKFVWSPHINAFTQEEVARSVVRFTRAILDGQTRLAPPIGDSMRVNPSAAASPAGVGNNYGIMKN